MYDPEDPSKGIFEGDMKASGKIAMFLVPFFLLIGSVLITIGLLNRDLSGSFNSKGAPLGMISFEPARCTLKLGNGKTTFDRFLLTAGVDEGALEVMTIADGSTKVRITVPGSCQGGKSCEYIDLDPKDCKMYDVRVQRKTYTENKFGGKVKKVGLVGKVGLECVFSGGGKVSSTIKVRECR